MPAFRWLWERSGLAPLPAEHRLILTAAGIAWFVLVDALTTLIPA
jgi:hypothetical protein